MKIDEFVFLEKDKLGTTDKMLTQFAGIILRVKSVYQKFHARNLKNRCGSDDYDLRF